MLPEEDGISVLKKLRSSSKTSSIPVIMLTAKDSEYDVVTGLDAGGVKLDEDQRHIVNSLVVVFPESVSLFFNNFKSIL